MRALSSAGQQAINDMAQRHGFSVEATLAMLEAVIAGNGTMAQFSHPEFGGSGQWMKGGMTMVADLFNSQLKGWVDALCLDLSNVIANQPELLRRGTYQSQSQGYPGDGNSGYGGLFAAGSVDPRQAWASDFGSADATGSQNGARYAWFAGPRRLVVEADGRTTVYDTRDHRIGGVSQQQSRGSSLSFSSQHGPVDLASLPVVSDGGAPVAGSASIPSASDAPPAQGLFHGPDAVFGAIEKLAAMREKGILSEEEFTSKKTELLKRV